MRQGVLKTRNGMYRFACAGKAQMALWLQVRSMRKRIVKKALALMEDIDNVKSSMLHSILVHANDAQSEFSEPPSGAVSEASEAPEEVAEVAEAPEESAEEADAGRGDDKPAIMVGGVRTADPELLQVADALAELKEAGEEAQAQTTKAQGSSENVSEAVLTHGGHTPGRAEAPKHSSAGPRPDGHMDSDSALKLEKAMQNISTPSVLNV